MKRFRGGLVFKAHRLVHHTTLGWRVIKKKKKHLAPLGRSPKASYSPEWETAFAAGNEAVD